MTTESTVIGFCSCGASFNDNPLNPPAYAIFFHWLAGHAVTLGHPDDSTLDNDATGVKGI